MCRSGVPLPRAFEMLAGDLRRGRRVASYGPLLIFAGLALVAFALFAVRVPRISALKASYLLQLSLPYGYFIALAVAAPPAWAAWAAWPARWLPALAWLALPAAAITKPKRELNSPLADAIDLEPLIKMLFAGQCSMKDGGSLVGNTPSAIVKFEENYAMIPPLSASSQMP